MAPLPDIYGQAKISHQLFHQNAPGLVRQFHLTQEQARAIVSMCPSCQQHALPALSSGANPRGLNSCEVWQTDMTHIMSFSRQRYVYVSGVTFSGALYASAHTGEKSSDAMKHLIQAFSFLGIPKSIKTDNGPTYTSKEFRSFLQQWGVEHKTSIPYSPTEIWERIAKGYQSDPIGVAKKMKFMIKQHSPDWADLQLLLDALTETEKHFIRIFRTVYRRHQDSVKSKMGRRREKKRESSLPAENPQFSSLKRIIGEVFGTLDFQREKKLDPERVASSIALPSPQTKREFRQVLGLLGYCRQWIEGYSEKVKFLYEKLKTDRLKWTEQDEQAFKILKETLVTAPVLSLPDVKRQFQLFVDVSNHTAYGVLTRDWAGNRKPVGYLSKLLDPVSKGWPTCLQAIVAVALLVEEAKKVTFGSPLVVYTPHNVRNILQQKADKWLTDARLLKYEAILIHSPRMELRTTTAQNPAQFLFGETLEKPAHSCAEIIALQTKIRPDLEEEEFEDGEKWFVDGSARVVEGKRKSGYAIVDGKSGKVVESGPLNASWSAHACELYAVLWALKRLKGNKGTIFTDSKYAFGVAHTFGKNWEEKGLINTQGRGLAHGEIIKQILEAIREPKEISIVYVKGHQVGMQFQIRGNNLADKEAKRAALLTISIPQVGENETQEYPPCPSKGEIEGYEKTGGRLEEGRWKLPDGRELLPKDYARKILKRLHQQTHWGAQALTDQFLKFFECKGIYELAKQEVHGCMICQKVNQARSKQIALGGRLIAYHPFERIQVDFTELPKNEEGLDPESKTELIAQELKRQESEARKKRVEQERLKTLSEHYEHLEKQYSDWGLPSPNQNLFIDLMQEIATVRSIQLLDLWRAQVSREVAMERDLLEQLEAGIIFKTGEISLEVKDQQYVELISIMLITKEIEVASEKEIFGKIMDQVSPGVWASNIPGRAKNALPVQIKLKEGGQPVRVKHYPLKKGDIEGVSPVIENFLQIGRLRECQSDFNTPILPVKKPDGSYRLVQDLRAVNKITANPYTLLTRLSPELTWFTVLDLKDAFFCLPLHEASQKIFAFEWESPKTGRKTQLTWCVLLQRYKNSPTIFGEQLAKDLESWDPPPGEGQLLQYVEELLKATQTQETRVDWTGHSNLCRNIKKLPEHQTAKPTTPEKKHLSGHNTSSLQFVPDDGFPLGPGTRHPDICWTDIGTPLKRIGPQLGKVSLW
ncbi:hypothetical protein DUI87_19138 [Hirundo rustica rustica]|uniref:Uncharacterized protein n=1 Tax=Hirundo rustica rustica TaxID=333673 RepID=A0A3M0JU34_HIRRU|nr:hypothetical protein DUI87_19138 [Hirundo rustica rustica]